MFYTKYRPQNFSEISKPNDVAAALMNQVKNNKIVHAYLFVGPRGTGKTTTARILAKALNCTNISKEGDPCGKCENCVSIQKGSFIDLIEIDAASNRGIDDIRELRDKIKLAPSVGKSKVYIIDEVHMLTTEAFNALLKTLEEPPLHAHFILCTTEFHKVPATIKSRCQVFKFKRASIEQLVEKLERISKEEKAKKLKREDLVKIAQASHGGFRDAETLLQQVVEGNLEPDSFVGLSSYNIYSNFVETLTQKNAKEALKQLNTIVDEGLDLNVWTLDLLQYLRDLLFVGAGAEDAILDTTDDHLNDLRKLSKKLQPDEITEYIEVFMEASNKLSDSAIPQLPLELAIVKITGTGGSNKKDVVEKKTHKPKIEITVKETIIEEIEEIEEAEEGEEEVIMSEIEIDVIKEKWEDVIKGTVSYNHSINALLKSCQPLKIDGRYLILEVYYAFHKDRIEAQKNREVIEGVIKEVIGTELLLKCEVNVENKPKKKKGSRETGELTDHNIIPAFFNGNAEEGESNFSDIFDGGLPL